MSESVAFLTGWAADIRASSGTSVDADSLEEAASIIANQSEEIARLYTALSESEQREKDARAKALDEASNVAAQIGAAFADGARDLRGSARDRRFYAAVADRIAKLAEKIRSLQSEERS